MCFYFPAHARPPTAAPFPPPLALLLPPPGGCEYYKNCASCVADTTCGWCGNDPYHAGGYGFTQQGDHVLGNPFSSAAYMVGGVGKVMLSGTGSTDVLGINTRFTQQVRRPHRGAVRAVPLLRGSGSGEGR